MNQEQDIILAFKIVDIAAVVTIAAFVLYYTRLARWWRNPIGRTIVAKDLALILALFPSILSIFFKFNRLTSHVAGWVGVVAFAMVPVIMIWRLFVWHRLSKSDRRGIPDNRQPDRDESAQPDEAGADPPDAAP